MLVEILTIAIGVLVPVLMLVAVANFILKRARQEPLTIDESELQAAEAALREEGQIDWVILKRCTGPAFNHAAMTEIVGALNAEGVSATYDVVASSSVDAGVTNYMLKVLRGEEAQAAEILSRLGHRL